MKHLGTIQIETDKLILHKFIESNEEALVISVKDSCKSPIGKLQ